MVVLESESNYEVIRGGRLKTKQPNNSFSQDDIVFIKEVTNVKEDKVRIIFKGIGPQPFLKNIFKMVKDSNTNPIVSRGEASSSEREEIKIMVPEGEFNHEVIGGGRLKAKQSNNVGSQDDIVFIKEATNVKGDKTMIIFKGIDL